MSEDDVIEGHKYCPECGHDLTVDEEEERREAELQKANQEFPELAERARKTFMSQVEQAARALFPDVANDPPPKISGCTFSWPGSKPHPMFIKFMNLLNEK